MLFDTHLHLIYPDKLSYPWLSSVEELNRPSTLEDYKKKASRLGIGASLHMEVDVAEHQIRDETALLRKLMSEPNSLIRGVISACRPESEEFPLFLDWAMENEDIVRGFRRVLHVVPDGLSQSKLFRENVKRLSDTRFTFDICALSRQLRLVIELVDFCPEVVFVLDHCGVPDIKSGELTNWSIQIRELAKRKNVTAKISGLIAYGNPETWSIEDIRPYFEETVAAFGHQRVIWGSDSPVCNLGGGLETWVSATHVLTNSWSRAHRDSLFWSNAAELWKLDVNF
ncbi:MAG: amidohydrolase [Pseudomonadota bacterium]|nr:amidohydrolase [Pseudomonadota bacterium]